MWVCAPATEENINKLKINLTRYYEDKKEDPSITLDDFLQDIFDDGLPLLSELTSPPTEVYPYVYYSDDGDIYDDLEDGIYLLIPESTLFIKQPTVFGEKLQEINITPEFSLWSTFG